jgi:ubiquinone/menaquinone biosynthesis C-methylase UbiE
MKITKSGLVGILIGSKLTGRHWLDLLTDGGILLDVGCGTGRLLEKIESYGIGIDLNSEALNEAEKKGRTVVRGVGQMLPFKEDSFSLVVSDHVIEHLYPHEAWAMLKESARVLKTEGFLVLGSEVENKKFWNSLSHIRPYPPSAIGKITNDTSQETFEKINKLFPVAKFYQSEAKESSIGFFAKTLLSQFIPALRKDYFLILQKK